MHKAGMVDGNQIMQEDFRQMMGLIQASCPNSIGPTGKMLKIDQKDTYSSFEDFN